MGIHNYLLGRKFGRLKVVRTDFQFPSISSAEHPIYFARVTYGGLSKQATSPSFQTTPEAGEAEAQVE
jgi:hypothetical protein